MSDVPAAEPSAVERTVVGVRPWLPWPLSRWRCWTAPVRAERLASLRIALGLVLLLDVLFTYLPHSRDFFGRDSLGSPPLFDYWYRPHWNAKVVREDLDAFPDDLAKGKPFDRTLGLRWRWSLLKDEQEPGVIDAALVVWAAAAFCLMIGLGARPSACIAWILSTSIANINTYVDNAGDTIRGITLFYLMLCPCGAAWSVDAWLKRRLGWLRGTAWVHPWPICLMFLQLIFIYWCNGLYKLTGNDWREGNSLYYVLADLTLTRWSYAQVQVPYVLTRMLTWMVLAWEAAFPLLVIWRPLRIVTLLFGVAFHLGIVLTMEIGGFVPYVLCLYLPLLPWEWLLGAGRTPAPAAAVT
jgi:hypothetical protein